MDIHCERLNQGKKNQGIVEAFICTIFFASSLSKNEENSLLRICKAGTAAGGTIALWLRVTILVMDIT